MEKNYDPIIRERAEHVFEVMAPRVMTAEMLQIREAFELAREAHAQQKRKTGEPYILHPIAVATIVAEEMMLGANPVCAAFLHDAVEDTSYTIGEIKERLGTDAAFLAKMVSKKPTHHREYPQNSDYFRRMLGLIQYDIRVVLVKLADCLHNMRTLASLEPEERMKIAGETNNFYAPLADSLGLYNIKTELENLSFRYRCPDEYEEISSSIAKHMEANRENLDMFKSRIEEALEQAGIITSVKVNYRSPFSLWRMMEKYDDDLSDLAYRHFIEIVFADNQNPFGAVSRRAVPLLLTEKEIAMKIYCILTDRFKEKRGGMGNYIDSPKKNGYQSLHFKLQPDFGRWQEVHVYSERMIRNAQSGCVAEYSEENIKQWVGKFRKVLRDVIDDETYTENDANPFDNDDIKVFTTTGEPILLPPGATALDFAYAVQTEPENHAYYARINGKTAPILRTLSHGDTVEIFTNESVRHDSSWSEFVKTDKAREGIRRNSFAGSPHNCCRECGPLPGDEVIGIRDPLIDEITIHRCNCKHAIAEGFSSPDNIVSVVFRPDGQFYKVEIRIEAVDRPRLMSDLMECVDSLPNLRIEECDTRTRRHCDVHINMKLGIHSYEELKTLTDRLSAVEGVCHITQERRRYEEYYYD